MDKVEQAVQLLRSVPPERLSEELQGEIANHRARLEVKAGRVDDPSLVDIDKALEVLGRQVVLLDTRAMIYLSRGACKQAIRDLQEATLFQVDSSIYHFHLALAYKCDKDKISARDALEVAKQMGLTPRNLAGAERRQYDKLKDWIQ